MFNQIRDQISSESGQIQVDLHGPDCFRMWVNRFYRWLSTKEEGSVTAD